MRHTFIRLAFALPGIVVASASAEAQDRSGNGFLFGAPTGTFSLHAGYAGANAGSDIFSFATSELTLRRRDFSSFGWGADMSIRLTERLAAEFAGDISGSEKRSEFREWLDNNDEPIEQTTSFSRQSYTAGLKWYLLPPGRSLGRLAWVPSRYAPFLGVGAGRMWYRFKQSGDFIDYEDGNRVFPDTYESSSWTGTAHVLAGVEWTLNQRWAATSRAKYEWASAELGRDFSGFQRIDLSGYSTTLGLTFRY